MKQRSNNPAVSIVIPCYNHGGYVREAIASVEQCDGELYEIIIINDGSTEEQTLRTVGELESEGYHVVNQENRGLAASRNTGISLARGRYILPLDADNKIFPNYLTLGIEILDKRPEVGVVYGRPGLFGDTTGRSYPEVGEFDLPRIIIENYIDACAIVRKSALEQCGGYDLHWPFPGWEDWDLWLTLATNGWKFHFEDALLFAYRMAPDSMISRMGQSEKVQQNMDYLCRKHALLLRRIIIEQQDEIINQPRIAHYSRLWKTHGFKGVLQKAWSKARRKRKENWIPENIR